MIEERGPVEVGRVWVLHVAPPSVVDTNTPLVNVGSAPTAQQSEVDVHDTPVSVPMPLGMVCGVQCAPPSVVTTTTPVVELI